jgi:hypothetical protein
MSGPQEDVLTAPQPVVSKEDVAKGAGLAAVARLGALIEVISQPAYTWMFGLAGYGVYVVLWAAINILANILDLAFGQALQRIIPATADEKEQHGAVRFALLLSTGLGVIAALAITLAAPWQRTPRMQRYYRARLRYSHSASRFGFSSKQQRLRRGPSAHSGRKSGCGYSGSKSHGWFLRRAFLSQALVLRDCCLATLPRWQ